MTHETPADRLARMLREGQHHKILTPKDDEFDPLHREKEKAAPEPPEGLAEVIQAVISDIKRRIGDNSPDSKVEIHEVTIGPEGIVIDGTKHNQKDEGETGEMISMRMDLTPLGQILDDRARDHAEQILRTHDRVVRELAATHDDGTLPRFAVAMGQIVVKAGMAGALLLAGRDGSDAIRPQDFQGAMIGSVGGVILSALRYGQAHPEALTAADGVPESALSDMVDQFLANLGGDEPTEGDE